MFLVLLALDSLVNQLFVVRWTVYNPWLLVCIRRINSKLSEVRKGIDEGCSDEDKQLLILAGLNISGNGSWSWKGFFSLQGFVSIDGHKHSRFYMLLLKMALENLVQSCKTIYIVQNMKNIHMLQVPTHRTSVMLISYMTFGG